MGCQYLSRTRGQDELKLIDDDIAQFQFRIVRVFIVAFRSAKVVHFASFAEQKATLISRTMLKEKVFVFIGVHSWSLTISD